MSADLRMRDLFTACKIGAVLHKSFYDLHFAVSPGGARKDAHHICGSVEEVRRALEGELSYGGNLYLLCWYGSGATLSLDVYERGERVHSIDLHPYVTISIEGHPDITFLGPGRPTGHDTGSGDPAAVREVLEEGMSAGTLACRAHVHWDRFEIPELSGEIADYGDLVRIVDNPANVDDDWEGVDLDGLDEDELEDELIDRGFIPYGFNDLDA